MISIEDDELGDKFWYNEAGQYHRENGPAVEYMEGHKAWYINGKRHREDGPAVVCRYGGLKSNEWWLNGKQVKKKLFGRLVKLKALW